MKNVGVCQLILHMIQEINETFVFKMSNLRGSGILGYSFQGLSFWGLRFKGSSFLGNGF